MNSVNVLIQERSKTKLFTHNKQKEKSINCSDSTHIEYGNRDMNIF